MNEYKILPKYSKLLPELGMNIKLARLRRKLNKKQISERANIAVYELTQLEDGNNETITLKTLLQVLIALNLQDDLVKVALDDILGRKLQDIELLKTDR